MQCTTVPDNYHLASFQAAENDTHASDIPDVWVVSVYNMIFFSFVGLIKNPWDERESRLFLLLL
jgi:hypothetical protein